MYNDTLIGTFVMVAVIGVVRSWLLVPQPLVIIEDVSIDKFASAYGIYGAISGVISILFGPIVGELNMLQCNYNWQCLNFLNIQK